jgi:hypothetical protein
MFWGSVYFRDAHVFSVSQWNFSLMFILLYCLRRFGPDDREIEDCEIAKLVADGKLIPSRSPWASPLVLVKKKDVKKNNYYFKRYYPQAPHKHLCWLKNNTNVSNVYF